MSEVASMGVAKAVHRLHTAELNSDSHIEANALFLASIANGRQAAGLPFGATQAALEEAGKAVAFSLESRRHLALAHQRLLKTVQEHDIDITDHGDIFPWCPNASGEQSLTTAASVAA
ncbi:hypothetical protein P1X14_03380 [Sphingomonas sp. AOB5]|uniref:hypothetical protein n=1 Tax=Sphingomonas sp. AOB5 TaxID=3034017 RepID=UPI0023F6E2EC|nr:hypothetical protein [Sphingomonas sp. AOB5]MDF7774280.1 hypothetical protein [Sphingomonas sp. AOB5]